MRLTISLLFAFGFVLNTSAQEISIIPQPANLQVNPGKFLISKKTVITARDEEDRKTAAFLNNYLEQFYGFKLDIDKQESKDYIKLTTRKYIKAPDKDAYILNVTAEGVLIEGDTYAGTFTGMQSLIQLLPVGETRASGLKLEIPFVSIRDEPRFDYRGMHLDVGRHFFPVEFIKKYIDYIALHKMNYFHWHLTEDQGWRIEIKKYPRLTEIGGCRNGTIIGRYPGKGNDNIKTCGYYTQEQVKEVVQYAADRFITVIPEIEMPGHSSAAIAAYPWLSCFPDEPTKIPEAMKSEASKKSTGKLVQETWGVFDDVFCAGRDSTFIFLQDVLDEVLTLFPSKYVHVGGDECPKSNWKRCPFCQKRIKDEGLKDEHELQSYFIHRMEKYLNSKGKTLIGWDEILEGGLAPNAIVMSWRGEAGGIAAAKEKHKVIMTPGNYVYLNYSQTRNEDTVTIGGFLPIEKVYGYEPIPKELNQEQAKYVIGAQGNVWSEYMRYPSTVEYMIFPRMSALSEVLWSSQEKKNWNNFEKRLKTQFSRYDLWGAHYSKAYYNLRGMVLPTSNNNGVLWKLETNQKGAQIFTRNEKSSAGMRYQKPILINSSTSLTAFSKVNGKYSGNPITENFSFNKATGKK